MLHPERRYLAIDDMGEIYCEYPEKLSKIISKGIELSLLKADEEGRLYEDDKHIDDNAIYGDRL